MKKEYLMFVIILMCAVFTSKSVCADIQYEIIELGVQVNATGINNNGQVVGIYSDGPIDHAVLWNNNSWTYLEGAMGHAYDINDNGQIVGWARATLDAPQYPVLWENGAIVEWNLGADIYGDARAINNIGQVIGRSDGIPYIWSSETGMQNYNFEGELFDINNSGMVVGGIFTRSPSGGTWNPYVYGFDLQNGGKFAQSVNDVGQVIIRGWDSSGRSEIWDSLNGYQLLQGLSGGNLLAWDINNSGLIVGTSEDKATIWINEVPTDLNSLIDPTSGWDLKTAKAINESGQIIGWGVLNGGAGRSYLLNPINPPVVPEPISCILFVAGGATLIGRQYIRRKKRNV